MTRKVRPLQRVRGPRHRIVVPNRAGPIQDEIDAKSRSKKKRLKALKSRIRKMLDNADYTVRAVFGEDFDDEDAKKEKPKKRKRP